MVIETVKLFEPLLDQRIKEQAALTLFINRSALTEQLGTFSLKIFHMLQYKRVRYLRVIGQKENTVSDMYLDPDVLQDQLRIELPVFQYKIK